VFDDIKPPAESGSSPRKRKTMPSFRRHGHSVESEFASVTEVGANETAAANPKVPKRRFQRWHNLSKKKKIGAGVAVALLIFVGSIGIFALLDKKPPPKQLTNVAIKTEPIPPPAPTTVASPLTGIQVAPDLAKRPVTAVMIENSPDARPQSGLQDAGVVFEAIAEAGITRFMGLFQEGQPSYVGPVRSLRPYYIDFASPFNASIAHVGGSPDALAQIRAGGKDLDQFFNGGYYHRISSRVAPHNVYTSFANFDKLNQSKGYTSSVFTPWVRKEPKALAAPTASKIDVTISSALYNSHYDYDPVGNVYMRSEGGKPHNMQLTEDPKSIFQLRPRVVVALVMSYSVLDKAGHSGYGINSSGSMLVFQDGGVTAGSWSKADRNSMFVFKDSAGNPLPLNTGQVWVVAVTSAGAVKYTP
jgi:hypothetical protein